MSRLMGDDKCHGAGEGRMQDGGEESESTLEMVRFFPRSKTSNRTPPNLSLSICSLMGNSVHVIKAVMGRLGVPEVI